MADFAPVAIEVRSDPPCYQSRRGLPSSEISSTKPGGSSKLGSSPYSWSPPPSVDCSSLFFLAIFTVVCWEKRHENERESSALCVCQRPEKKWEIYSTGDCVKRATRSILWHVKKIFFYTVFFLCKNRIFSEFIVIF